MRYPLQCSEDPSARRFILVPVLSLFLNLLGGEPHVKIPLLKVKMIAVSVN